MELPVLSSRFVHPDRYEPSDSYELLPFRFMPFDSDRYIATNLVGEYVLVHRSLLDRLIDGSLPRRGPAFDELKSKQFVLESDSNVAIDLLAAKYRTQNVNLAEFTGLHIFVVTLRCDHSCPYCQVSRVSEDKATYDMTKETAARSIDLMFSGPSHTLKVEFQGGESLLNFDLIRFVVERVQDRNLGEGRDVEFVIATNLTPLTDSILEFCKQHRIYISTSLDGPPDLHNANRPRPGGDSFERTIDGIRRVRSVLGHDAVSALMTTTRRSLDRVEEIIDCYVENGFDGVFLRWLSPYGFAIKTASTIGYKSDAFNEFYARGLRYILELNRQGVPFSEQLAAIVLQKILTPYDTGFVDLRSPTGLGIGVVVYNYDGDVYASDESRMLAEAGDYSFRLGNVHRDSFEDIFGGDRLEMILDSTMAESTPQCTDCAYLPYCGTDPVLHHSTQGDMVGHRPTSQFCKRNMFLFHHLIGLIEDDPEAAQIMRGWVRR